ncbi:MAG: hypothetical protein IMF19_01890, partial [Proteobacteria bacterium]|nr:hypothetical protein [Pseudomonadota bacterium]
MMRYYGKMFGYHWIFEQCPKMESFEESVQKRLKMIEKNWKGLTAFYLVEGAPA